MATIEKAQLKRRSRQIQMLQMISPAKFTGEEKKIGEWVDQVDRIERVKQVS